MEKTDGSRANVGSSGFDLFPETAPWEDEVLRASIERLGVLIPVVRDEHGRTIDGRRRERICQELGRTDYPVLILAGLSEGEKRDHSLLLNLVRRRLSRRQMRDLIAAELRRTPDRANNWIAQILGTTDKTVDAVRQRLIASSEIPKFERLRGMDGKSRPSVRITTRNAQEAERAQEAIRQITDAATREPEKYDHLLDRLDKTGRYNGVVRDLRIAREAEKIRYEPQPLPEGPYRVAVVDPPWQYDAKYSPSRRSVTPYPVMTVDEIKEVPIPSIMHEDSILLMWITNKHLAEGAGAEILRHWGYRPVSTLTWVKDRVGTGIWMRGQTEHAVLAIRGDVSPPQQPESTLLSASRPRGHSTKPDEFYQLVERAFPGSKVEIFSRKQRPGWVCWGSELWGTDQVPPKLTPRRRVARAASGAGVVVEV